MMSSAFGIGADVVVISLGGKAGVIIATGGGSRYRVRVGALTMWCGADDLETPKAARPKRRVRRDQASADQAPLTAAAPAPCIDLHGMTVEDAISQVLIAIDAAIVGGAERLKVVHGKGTGRLKSALHRELPRIASVRAVTIDPHNPGVTWVTF